MKLIEIPFLEQRDYIQGASLFEALQSNVIGQREISFRIREELQTNLVLTADPSDFDMLPAATLSWRGPTSGEIGVWPLPNYKIPQREPFDEAALLDTAIFDEDDAVTVEVSIEDFVRTIVAANKTLLERSDHEKGRWIFAALRLDTFPEFAGPVTVRTLQSAGDNMIWSGIETNAKLLGRILFAWQKKLP
jgi:hypothetical protein